MADRLLVSTTKGLFAFERNATSWKVKSTSFLGEKVSLTFPDPRDGAWYVAMNLGHFGTKLKYSPDQGKTWEDRAAPAYADGDVFASFDGKAPQPATMKGIWAIEAQGTGGPGHLWAGTAPGGLFRSEDGGKSWNMVRGLWDRPERMKWFGGGTEFPALHSICVDPRDSKTVRVAVSCGGASKTTDDGKTWESIGEGMFAEFMPPEMQKDLDIQDPHMMVQCRDQPDHMWIQHHNGVFYSTNGGQHFETIANIKPSVFGFGVAVHPNDGKTAWFVPAIKDERRIPVDGKLVVTRTRDGGKSFDVLTNGLPQENAYDLIYRHALAIDDTGDRLAMGSTTGGLWITENQGDSWKELSAHLPPIQAVRFC
jgi:ligand-binding sensor domain-containing protein